MIMMLMVSMCVSSATYEQQSYKARPFLDICI